MGDNLPFGHPQVSLRHSSLIPRSVFVSDNRVTFRQQEKGTAHGGEAKGLPAPPGSFPLPAPLQQSFFSPWCGFHVCRLSPSVCRGQKPKRWRRRAKWRKGRWDRTLRAAQSEGGTGKKVVPRQPPGRAPGQVLSWEGGNQGRLASSGPKLPRNIRIYPLFGVGGGAFWV